MSFDTRKSLLLRLRDKADREAWATFPKIYSPLVYRQCRLRGISHEDAEDLTQRAFARVLNGIERFEYDREQGRFRDWLGEIVRNEIYRHWRDRGRTIAPKSIQDSNLVAGLAADGMEAEWNDEFRQHVLQEAIKLARTAFREDTWRAFELVWIEDKAPEDAAREINQSIGSVYISKSRVLKKLPHIVETLTDDATWNLRAKKQ